MMSLWDALRMNMMISYQELVRTFLKDQVVMKSTTIKSTANSLKNVSISFVTLLKHKRNIYTG